MERTYWLKSVGSADDRQAEDWIVSAPRELTEVGFPDKGRPSVRPADYLVYYASGHQKIIGIVEVNSRPTDDSHEERWPWRCKVRAHLVLASIERSPSIDVIRSPVRNIRDSLHRQSHIEISEEEYGQALRALEAAFDASNGDILNPGPFFQTDLR